MRLIAAHETSGQLYHGAFSTLTHVHT